MCFDLNICSILFGKRRQMESRQNKMGECYTRVILFESRVTRIINKQLSSLVDFLTQISLTHFRLKLSVPLGMKFWNWEANKQTKKKKQKKNWWSLQGVLRVLAALNRLTFQISLLFQRIPKWTFKTHFIRITNLGMTNFIRRQS